MGRKSQKNDSLPGSLDMLILKTLRRIYTITPKGRKQLVEETARYKQLTLAIARVMEID
jgi:hypothetical protein